LRIRIRCLLTLGSGMVKTSRSGSGIRPQEWISRIIFPRA
jgi:hypothetical protein